MLQVQEIIRLFESRGGSQYGGEAVTQLEHALQCATLADSEAASPELVIAALLHDIGHLLHELPDDTPDHGIDDHHESSAGKYLTETFPPAVTEPIRMHVDAKRFLSATDFHYQEQLSEPSILSLQQQGGEMTPTEIAEFEQLPFARDAIRLRRWDDAAKDPLRKTPPIAHFEDKLYAVKNT
jgi:phosphonate degradation associated HDIG domain protein